MHSQLTGSCSTMRGMLIAWSPWGPGVVGLQHRRSQDHLSVHALGSTGNVDLAGTATPTAATTATCPMASTPPNGGALLRGRLTGATDAQGLRRRRDPSDSDGHVCTAGCAAVAGRGGPRPLSRADGNGQYDNSAGFRLGATSRPAADWWLPASTRSCPGGILAAPSIHVKVAGPGKPALTSQLFFPNSDHQRPGLDLPPGAAGKAVGSQQRPYRQLRLPARVTAPRDGAPMARRRAPGHHLRGAPGNRPGLALFP